jgi:hypothetical protein
MFCILLLLAMAASPSHPVRAASSLVARPRTFVAATPLTAADRYFFGFLTKWKVDQSTGGPHGLATDDSGNVYVMTFDSLYKYTNAGTLVIRWGSRDYPGGVGCAAGIAVDPSGVVYVAAACVDSVWRFTRTGERIGGWSLLTGVSGQMYPGAIAVDDSSNVYVTDPLGTRVLKYTSSGKFLKQWGTRGSGPGEFSSVGAIATDARGRVYVADPAAARIELFTSVGAHLATLPAYATSLAVDAAADVYVVDEAGCMVVKIDSTGVERDRWGSRGRGDGQFGDPATIGVDRDGNVFVGDAGNNRVQKFGTAPRWLAVSTAGPNGAVRPSGETYIAEGMDQSYAIVPDAGYRIAEVRVDGAPVGAISTHTFADVHSDHTIEARFITLDGWPDDVALNDPVCADTSDQIYPQIVSDGQGGAIVAWYDLLNYATTAIGVYAQRLDPRGRRLWPERGVLVSDQGRRSYFLRLVPDGASGGFLLWSDLISVNDYDLYVQHLDASGAAQWPAGGVAVCPDPRHQSDGDMVADGSGGAIVAWLDAGPGFAYGIRAQRIDAGGFPRWGANGVTLTTVNSATAPHLAPDGAGGAIVVWADGRFGNGYDLFAQRIGANGAIRWTANGVPVCVAPGSQDGPVLVPDGTGGALVAWQDRRSGPPFTGSYAGYDDIYIQRIDSIGVARGAGNGVPLCTSLGDQVDPHVIPDGAGGAFVAWSDWTAFNVAIQRIDAAGAPQWAAGGLQVCATASERYYTALTPDGNGGVLVAWVDWRRGSSDLYAQRVNANGQWCWSSDGVALCTASSDLNGPCLTTDGGAGAIAVWYDDRNWNYDLFAQRIDRYGMLGGRAPLGVPREPTRAISLESIHPNPLISGPLRLTFTLARPAAASLRLVDIAGRCIEEREVGSLGQGRHVIELAAGVQLAPGIYFISLVQGENVRTARVVVLR